jgi:hypothetical protein
MKFREIANGASGRQFDRESKYPLPVALMVIGTRKIGTRKKARRPIRLRFKLMCPRSRYQRRLQFSVGRGELHVGPGLMHPEPATLDCQLHAGAVFGRRAALLVQERPVDLLDVNAPVLYRLERSWRSPSACARRHQDRRRGVRARISSRQPPCLPCLRRASRFSEHHRAAALATPWPHPTARNRATMLVQCGSILGTWS